MEVSDLSPTKLRELDCCQDLASLLYPVLPNQFKEQFWNTQPVYIPAVRQKFRELLDQELFKKLSNRFTTLRAGRANPSRTQMIYLRDIQPEEIHIFYRAGATICGTGVELAVPHLAEFIAIVKGEMSFPGHVDFRGYLSGDRSGFTTHFDARHTTTIQIEGEKIWRFARTSIIEFPAVNAAIGPCGQVYVGGPSGPEPSDIKAPDDSKFEHVILHPGDVLYLPPGTWHNAVAVGHSFSLNLAFNY